jgi:DNA-binding transcriptional regulator YdaS (Cro superfamily)
MKDTNTPAGAFFDTLRRKYSLKSDAALAEFLNLHAPDISKMRTGVKSAGAAAILAIHEATMIPVAEIRKAVQG